MSIINLEKLVKAHNCVPGYEQGYPPERIDIVAERVTKIILCESEETKTFLIEIYTGDPSPVKLYFDPGAGKEDVIKCYERILGRI